MINRLTGPVVDFPYNELAGHTLIPIVARGVVQMEILRVVRDASGGIDGCIEQVIEETTGVFDA